MTLTRILVAVDGSDGSARALDWAIGLAGDLGAEVVAVHALGLLDRLDTGHLVPTEAHRDEIRRRFEEEWCAPLRAAHPAARLLLRDGAPVTVLLDAVDEVDADLVVLGSRGLDGRPELLLGSTSTQVAQRSRRPVAIVPEP